MHLLLSLERYPSSDLGELVGSLEGSLARVRAEKTRKERLKERQEMREQWRAEFEAEQQTQQTDVFWMTPIIELFAKLTKGGFCVPTDETLAKEAASTVAAAPAITA